MPCKCLSRLDSLRVNTPARGTSGGDADDRVKATNLALLATDRDTARAEALINEMIGEAAKFVEQHWPDIEALAQRLLVEGRVNFLEIEAGASES